MGQIREEIKNSMARTLFVSAYADAIDDQDNPIHGPKAGPGEDWMDVAPTTLPIAFILAEELIVKYEEVNNMCIDDLWMMACRACGDSCSKKRIHSTEEFGHCLAMSSLGHGISWFDNHDKFQLEIAHCEFYICENKPTNTLEGVYSI